MRKNHAAKSPFMIANLSKCKRFAGPFAKIGAEKSSHPGASAFRHGDDYRVPAGQLSRAAAEIPPAKTASPTGVRRFSRNARDFVEQFHVTLGEAFQRITFLDQFAPA